MKKLSSITESVWADLHSRGVGELEREEDIITTREELNEIIKSVYEEQGQGDTLTLDFTGKKILVDDMSLLFYPYRRDIKHIYGLETLDVSQVTNMRGMFLKCYALKKLNIGNWDVSQVKDMSDMFSDCFKLQELDLNKWNVSSVEVMRNMFYYCNNLTELHIENWDVRNVTDMFQMFSDCPNLKELDLNNWVVSNVKDMKSMFYGCPIQYIKKGNKLIKRNE